MVDNIQAFSQMFIQESCGQSFFKENCSFEQALWHILDAHISNLAQKPENVSIYQLQVDK